MATPARPKYILLDKQVGVTPLAAIEAWKATHPEYRDVPMSYAGRLDPMASGLLVVLVGDECKRKDRYTGLDKEYEVEVVLGIGTDTGDALGIPTSGEVLAIPEEAIRTALRSVTGTHTVPYPAFSSKTVNGKPLFAYALEGTLDTIERPMHKETVHRIELEGFQTLTAAALENRVVSLLLKAPKAPEESKALGADFRQNAIRTAWEESFAATPNASYPLLTLRVTCSSGTYMRTLAERIGQELDTSGFTLSIRRTRIGTYLPLGRRMGVWLKQY